MLFSKKIKEPPLIGSLRIKTYFAWIPISIVNNGIETTKWLQYVTVLQRYEYGSSADGTPPYWDSIEFINHPKK